VETLPAWVDLPCTTNSWGGICELQPSNSSNATRLLPTKQRNIESNILYTAHSSVVELFLEKDVMILDLSGSSSETEWIIRTDPDRIFYFSFLIPEDTNEQLISSALTVIFKYNVYYNGSQCLTNIQISSFKVIDKNERDVETILYPNPIEMETQISPFYSTGNTVSIKFTKSLSNLNGFKLKIEKVFIFLYFFLLLYF